MKESVNELLLLVNGHQMDIASEVPPSSPQAARKPAPVVQSHPRSKHRKLVASSQTAISG
jgi:hypothetical protein